MPLRTTSASPCITRTSRPHPAGHSVQMLGFQVAMPGTKVSSGMKRMSCWSGLPQESSAAATPVRAEIFKKSRRSMKTSETPSVPQRTCAQPCNIKSNNGTSGNRRARCAADGNQAIAHVQIHDALGDGLLGHIAVARRALHASTNVRSMIEPHVRRRRCSRKPAAKGCLRRAPCSAATFLISGFSLAITLMALMQKRTPGIPASGPWSTPA